MQLQPALSVCWLSANTLTLLTGGICITAPTQMLDLPFWAAASEGLYSVEHGGEFPGICSSIHLYVVPSPLSQSH